MNQYGPTMTPNGIITCRNCGHMSWYHCGHPGAPQGEVVEDELAGPVLTSLLPAGSPTPTPIWCPYGNQIAHLENMIAINVFQHLISLKSRS